MSTSKIEQRRNFFPRGLYQPENGFRFSVDSLLLSCFVPVKEDYTLLDLGTGCAVISLALFLQNPEKQFEVTGVDVSKELLEAAAKNARMLDLEENLELLQLDLRNFKASRLIEPESFDVVLSNPPYRDLERGRCSAEENKTRARFEKAASLQDFIQTGVYALKNKGSFCFVYLADRLPYLLNLLQKYRLEPKRLCFVHGFGNKEARLVLLQARKNGKPGLTVEAPLILYAQSKRGSFVTDQALRFCPFLNSNPLKPEIEI
jgi:tRNA1Val (adenine37-N6)-methyltransferase